MTSSPYFRGFILLWFFVWGFSLLKFPAQCYRILSWGKAPDERQEKRAKFVGYIAFSFGALFVIELVFGFLNWTK